MEGNIQRQAHKYTHTHSHCLPGYPTKTTDTSGTHCPPGRLYASVVYTEITQLKKKKKKKKNLLPKREEKDKETKQIQNNKMVGRTQQPPLSTLEFSRILLLLTHAMLQLTDGYSNRAAGRNTGTCTKNLDAADCKTTCTQKELRQT